MRIAKKCGAPLAGGGSCKNRVSSDKGATTCRHHKNIATRAARTTTRSDKQSATSDFNHGYQPPRVSVFSDKFEDVLFSRYGDDPRAVDEEAAVLFHHYRVDQSLLVTHQRNMRKNSARGRLSEDQLARLTRRETELEEKARNSQRDYEEYMRDNPVEWPQYYLVNNENGHLHNNLGCSTLYADTQLALYTPASGMETSEAIELAGHRICTVCVPEAPTNVSTMTTHVFSDEEKEKQERAREKEKRAEEKRLAAEEKQRRQQAAAKRREAAHKADALSEPLVLPKLNTQVWDYEDDKATTITTHKKLREEVKNSCVSLLHQVRGLSGSYSGDETREVIIDGINRHPDIDYDKKQQCIDALRRNWDSPHGYAVVGCHGDISQQVQNFAATRDAISILAENKNKTFDAMLDDVLGKRTLTSAIKNMEKDLFLSQAVRDCPSDPKEILSTRLEDIRGWVKNPESFAALTS